MNRFTARCLVFTIFVVCCESVHAEVAFVWLKDGRMLSGHVDARTNDERLWLRSSAKTFVLATSAAWENIVAANVGGKQLAAAELKRIAEEIKSPVPEQHGVATSIDNAVTNVVPARIKPNAALRVQSIDVEAHVANWDRDADSDGVEVHVMPRNIFGNVVPVSAHLLVKLAGRKRLPLPDEDAFPQLGRWSLRTDANDFGAYGAVYRLPFRNYKPRTDLSLEPHGLIETQLFVFGQGRFEAETPVYIRTFNPLREDLQRHRARRDR